MNVTIEGTLAPYLEIDLEDGDALVAEPGSLLAKEPSVGMRAALSGGLGAALRRALAGTSFFLVEYEGPGHLTLTKGTTGRLIPLTLDDGRALFVTSAALLCAERGIELEAGIASDAFGLFWAQLPVVMLRVSGKGRAFALARGDVKEVHLGKGESIEVAPGRIVWLESTATVKKASSPSLKDALLGGVGLSLARVTGPGAVCLQTWDYGQERRKAGGVVVHKGSHRAPPRRDDDDHIKEPWIWDGHRD